VPFLFSIRYKTKSNFWYGLVWRKIFFLSLAFCFWQVLDVYQKDYGDTWRFENSSQPWPYLKEASDKFRVLEALTFLYLWILFKTLGTICCVNYSYFFLEYLQDPAEADKLLKIQRELDETKIILVSAVPGSWLLTCMLCFLFTFQYIPVPSIKFLFPRSLKHGRFMLTFVLYYSIKPLMVS